MRKPLHEASLNHVLKSEGGAPESGRRSAPEFNPAKPEDTDLQLQQVAHVNAMATAQDDVTAN
jgi:hypothetical protein